MINPQKISQNGNFNKSIRFTHLIHSNEFFLSKTLIAKIVNEIIWGGTIVFGAVLLIVMISLTWGRIKNTAILTTTVDTYYHPNWKVPFPALTLCNINQIHRKQLNLIIDEV